MQRKNLSRLLKVIHICVGLAIIAAAFAGFLGYWELATILSGAVIVLAFIGADVYAAGWKSVAPRQEPVKETEHSAQSFPLLKVAPYSLVPEDDRELIRRIGGVDDQVIYDRNE